MIYCWTHRRIRPGCCFIKLSAQERHAEMEVIAMPRTCWKDPKAEIKMKVSQNATPIDEKKTTNEFFVSSDHHLQLTGYSEGFVKQVSHKT